MKNETCSAQYSFEVGTSEMDFERFESDDPKLTGRQIIEIFGGSPVDEHLVFEMGKDGYPTEIALRKSVALQVSGESKFIVFNSSASYRFTFEGRLVEWGDTNITSKTLHTLFAANGCEEAVWMALKNEPDRMVLDGEIIDLSAEGLERFYLQAPEWQLNVQGVRVSFSKPKVSAHEALTKAGFDADAGWIAVLKVMGKPKQTVEIGDEIDLSAPGVEKLRLTPKEINNGELLVKLRQEFALLEGDQTFLEERSFAWETILENGRRWFVLRDYPLPDGYGQTMTDVAIEIPTGYPTAQLDMFYCFPHLQRSDGVAIPTTQLQQPIEGKSYQRWSRHRGTSNPWNPHFDSLVSQIILAEEAILREVMP